MDTENRQWFCDICNKKYSTNRKDNHLQTEVHKKSEERIRCAADFENHITYKYRLLMGECGDMPFSKYLERSVEVYTHLKRQFNENYMNEDI